MRAARCLLSDRYGMVLQRFFLDLRLTSAVKMRVFFSPKTEHGEALRQVCLIVFHRFSSALCVLRKAGGKCQFRNCSPPFLAESNFHCTRCKFLFCNNSS